MNACLSHQTFVLRMPAGYQADVRTGSNSAQSSLAAALGVSEVPDGDVDVTHGLLHPTLIPRDRNRHSYEAWMPQDSRRVLKIMPIARPLRARDLYPQRCVLLPAGDSIHREDIISGVQMGSMTVELERHFHAICRRCELKSHSRWRHAGRISSRIGPEGAAVGITMKRYSSWATARAMYAL